MNTVESHLEDASVVFAIELGFYVPFDQSRPQDNDVGCPELDVYRTANDAIAGVEGLSIVETLDGYGDTWLFAADGSPLEAHFSQEPYFNTDKPTYFPGIYSLHPGTGPTLMDAMAKIMARNQDDSPQARIIVFVASTNEVAKAVWLANTCLNGQWRKASATHPSARNAITSCLRKASSSRGEALSQ